MNGRKPVGVLVAFGLTVVALGVLVFLMLTIGDEEAPAAAGAGSVTGQAQAERQAGPPAPDLQDEYQEYERRLALVGTVVASRRRWSTATILDLQTNKSDGYRIGDRVPTGARLRAIRADRVILVKDGERETLLLSEGIERAASAEAPGIDEERQADSPEGAIAEEAEPYVIPEDLLVKTGEGSYTVGKQEFERLMRSPGDLLRSSLFTLAIDPAGRMEGLRLAIGPQGTLFRRAGFKSGDVIEEIGPLVLDGPASLEKIGEVLSDATELELRIRRGGRPISLRYVFK